VADLILLGLVIAIEPLPVIGFILVLSTDRGTRNGAAFIAAWFACLVAIVVATLFVTGGRPPKTSTAPATAVGIVNLFLGALLLVVAVRVRARPADAPRKTPSWMSKLDHMGAGTAAALGVLLQPWPLVAAGAASVAEADLSSGLAVVELVLFCLLATSALATMEIYSVVSPEASRARLDALRSWLDRHREQGIVIISVSVGLWLVGKGIYTLVTQT
jgi:hypothetical protein